MKLLITAQDIMKKNIFYEEKAFIFKSTGKESGMINKHIFRTSCSFLLTTTFYFVHLYFFLYRKVSMRRVLSRKWKFFLIVLLQSFILPSLFPADFLVLHIIAPNLLSLFTFLDFLNFLYLLLLKFSIFLQV